MSGEHFLNWLQVVLFNLYSSMLGFGQLVSGTQLPNSRQRGMANVETSLLQHGSICWS